jgi:uncharacterized protein
MDFQRLVGIVTATAAIIRGEYKLINKYYLMIGKACNLSCIYCHQGLHNVRDNDITVNPKKVASYFPQTGKYTVMLYGGEPLLYWDYIQRLAVSLKERNPNVNLRTITNGTLLTVNTAKKLNELGISVGVSHDGYKFEETRRTKDFLKSNPEPYLTLEKRSISATASKINYNFYDVWKYFEEFRIKNGLASRENCHIEVICDVEGNTDVNLLMKDMPKFEQMLDKVFLNLEKAIKGNDFSSYEYRQYRPMLESLNYRLQHPSMIFSRCGADSQVCHIDIHGNLYPCHNMGNPNGHIAISGIQPGRYNPYKDLAKCQTCIAYVLCGGGCIATSQTVHSYECYARYHQVVRLLNLLQKLLREGWMTNDCFKK